MASTLWHAETPEPQLLTACCGSCAPRIAWKSARNSASDLNRSCRQSRTTQSGSRAVAAKARVLGTTTFRSNNSGIVKAKVSIAKRYRKAIRIGRIRKVTAVVRDYNGKVAKRLTIRIKR